MSDADDVIEWELPRDVLVTILYELPVKSIARCASVAKSWKNVVKGRPELGKKVALESAWRCKEVEPTVMDLYEELIRNNNRKYVVNSFAMFRNKIALGFRDQNVIGVFDTGTWEMVAQINSFVNSLAFLDEVSLFGIKGCSAIGWDLMGCLDDVTFSPRFFDVGNDPFEFPIQLIGAGDYVVVGSNRGLIETWKRGRVGLTLRHCSVTPIA